MTSQIKELFSTHKVSLVVAVASLVVGVVLGTYTANTTDTTALATTSEVAGSEEAVQLTTVIDVANAGDTTGISNEENRVEAIVTEENTTTSTAVDTPAVDTPSETH